MNTTITRCGSHLEVRFPWNPPLVEAVKRLDPRRQWVPESKAWRFPAERMVAERLVDLLSLPAEYLPADVRELLPDTAIEPSRPVDLSRLNGWEWRTPPYDHQRAGLATLLERNRFLLAWEMGAGKSHALANRLRWGIEHNEFTGPILILCPKGVLSVWPDQLREHAGLSCTVLTGKSKEKALQLREPRGIYLTNYESLTWCFEALKAARFDVVVFDEIQRCKGNGAQSKAARKVAAGARYRWGLSGTPAPNGLIDWFGVLTVLDPNILGTESKTAFENRYCVKAETSSGVRIIVGYRDVPDLMRRVRSVSSRVTKEQCIDLPPKTYVDRRCTLEGDQARVYRELKNKAVANLKSAKADGVLSVRNVLTESLRLLQACGGWLEDDDGHKHALTPNAKMCLLDEVLEEIGQRQVVVWCQFRAEVDALAKRLSEEGTTATFYGGTPHDERGDIIRRFQAGEIQYLVATPMTGGAGITLTAADTEIYYSRGWNLADWLQSQDRLHRLGQRRPVTIISLIASGTVDEKVAAALARKQGIQEMMLGGDVEELL